MPIKVCHITTGDIWAGAEVQLGILLASPTFKEGFEVSAIVFNEGKLVEELRNEGIRVTVVAEKGNNSLGILRKLIGHFRINPCHIIHTHKPKDNILGAIAGKIAKVPYIVRTYHGLPEPFKRVKQVMMSCYKVLDDLTNTYMVTKVIAVSENLEDVLSKRYGHRNVLCIHNGIELASRISADVRARKRKELGIGEDCQLIGAVGRLTAVKGLDVLLQALLILTRNRKNIRLWLVGDGPLRHTLLESARRLGVLANIAFLGHRDDTLELMHLFDLFAMPSLYEGIPMALLEAMGASLPVVASRVGGIPEVIEEEVSGLLAVPGDPEDLATKFCRVLDDPILAKRLGVAARRRVEEEFSAIGMAEKTAHLYRGLIND